MPSINLIHAGKSSKEENDYKQHWLLLCKNNNLLVNMGKWSYCEFQNMESAIHLRFSLGTPVTDALPLCVSHWRKKEREIIPNTQENPGKSWGFPGHNCQVHNVDTVTTVIMLTLATHQPPKEGSTTLVRTTFSKYFLITPNHCHPGVRAEPSGAKPGKLPLDLQCAVTFLK
jgi:hypothetical protein